MEKLNLTTPIPASTLTDYQVMRLDLNWAGQVLHVDIISNTGKHLGHEYRGATAVNLMVALNKANLSVKSLHKRVLEQLVADGILAGSISGSPD